MKNHMLTVPLAAAGALVLVLTGCTSGGGAAKDDPNAEVAFWSYTGIGAQDSVDKYLAQMPDAKVKLTEVGTTTETATALTAALAGGKVPDLVMIQNDDLPKFVENSGNFVDLRTVLGDDIGSKYLDWAVAGATAADGSLVGLPTDVGGLAFAYRTDLFEAAGLPTDPDEVAALWPTWDDFINVGKQYTAKTGKPFIDNVDTSVWFSSSNQVTEKYYDQDGKLIYDTNPQIKEAFGYAVDTYEAGISANIAAWSTGWDPGKANGAFAVTVAPSWLLSGIENAAPDTSGLWRVANVPGVGGNWGGSVIAIPARANNIAGAVQYIKTMLSPEAQTVHFEDTGTFPAAKDALDSDAVATFTNPFFGDSLIGATIANSVKKFPVFPLGPDEGVVQAGFYNALVEMQNGNVAPADAWQVGLDNVSASLGG